MDTQIQTKITPTWNLQCVLLEVNPPAKSQQYTAYDFGYELDADEVGQAMAAEYSNGSFDRPTVEPEEFETVNRWFLS